MGNYHLPFGPGAPAKIQANTMSTPTVSCQFLEQSTDNLVADSASSWRYEPLDCLGSAQCQPLDTGTTAGQRYLVVLGGGGCHLRKGLHAVWGIGPG